MPLSALGVAVDGTWTPWTTERTWRLRTTRTHDIPWVNASSRTRGRGGVCSQHPAAKRVRPLFRSCARLAHALRAPSPVHDIQDQTREGGWEAGKIPCEP